MTTRNSHGQLTLTGYLATLNPTDLAQATEIFNDSGISARVSVKTAVLHPNVITRYKLLASLLDYDAKHNVVVDTDLIEGPVVGDDVSPDSDQTNHVEAIQWTAPSL